MSDKYYYEYDIDSDYCYPGTYVLKNKLNITDEDELKSAERSITSLRTAQLMQYILSVKGTGEHRGCL